jgi:transposase
MIKKLCRKIAAEKKRKIKEFLKVKKMQKIKKGTVWSVFHICSIILWDGRRQGP